MEQLTRSLMPNRFTIALLAAVAVLAGIVTGVALFIGRDSSAPVLSTSTNQPLGRDFRENEYTGSAWWVNPPKDMDSYVAQMDAIVIGTVKSVLGHGSINSYNLEDNERILRSSDPVSPALPITDYELVVEKVLLGDESIRPGESIILRSLGDDPDQISGFPALLQMPQVGDHRLYGLGRNPDGITFGTHGWWSQFIIDSAPVSHTDDLRASVSFAKAEDPDLFIKEIEAAVAARKPAP